MKISTTVILFLFVILMPAFTACTVEDDIDISKSHVCGHKTKDGGYCKRIVADGHRYCWQHR